MTEKQKERCRKILQKFVGKYPTQQVVANKFGITSQAINGWMVRGMVPKRFVEEIAKATGHHPHNLRPDLFDV